MPVFVAISEGENVVLLGVFSTLDRAIDACMTDIRDTLGAFIGAADEAHQLWDDLRTTNRTRISSADVLWGIHADELDRPLG